MKGAFKGFFAKAVKGIGLYRVILVLDSLKIGLKINIPKSYVRKIT